MTNYKEILRLYSSGDYSQREIALALSISRNTVSKCIGLSVVMAVCLASCSSLFGGGDWKASAKDTIVVEKDEFTLETEYSIKESGLLYSMLPIKLKYTDGPDSSKRWGVYVTHYSSMSGSRIVTELMLLNSRGDRYVNKSIGSMVWEYTDNPYCYFSITNEEVDQIYQVLSNTEDLDYIRLRCNSKDEYQLTQAQAYAVTNFIDYVRANVDFEN